MANKQFKVPINLVNLASDPGTASEGDIYFNTTDDVVKVYANGAWVAIGAGGGGSTITVSGTAPTSPEIGDAWYDNTDGSFYVYDGTFWVEVNGTVSLSQEQVQDYVAPLFDHANHTNITASYDDANNQILLTGSSAVSGNLTNIDSITYPDYITFDTTPETIPTATGSIYWDSGDSLPATVLNANVSIGLGQEQVALVKNATGASIAKGKVVYISGAQGQRPTITLSDADMESTSSKTFGLTAEAIADGAEGFVTTFGVLRGVNTDGLTQGAPLWLSSTAGEYTTSVPAEPAHAVFIGYVVKAHASSGEIFVNIQNGYELNELHGVQIDGTPADNEVLAYDTTSGLWINQTADEANLVNKTDDQTISGNKTFTGWVNLYSPFGTPGTDSGIGRIEYNYMSDRLQISAYESSSNTGGNINLFATNDIVFSSQDGSVYLNSNLSASNEVATIGDINALSSVYQPLDSDLTAISGLSGSGLLSKNSSGTWSFDTTTYLSGTYNPDGNLSLSTSGSTLVASLNSNVTVSGSLVIGGDLTVNGTTTTLNTETLAIEDNIITLNSNVTGSPSANAGVEVERGSSTNVSIRWNETNDVWEYTNDGTTYSEIGSGAGTTVSATAPASPTEGMTWFNTTDNLLYVYDGTYWIEVTSIVETTLTQLFTVSTTAPTSPVEGLGWFNNETGSFFIYDGTFWIEVNSVIDNSYPSQSGNAGKFLTTDGTDVSWASVDALPSQTGNDGKYLTTDGSTASWAEVAGAVYQDEAPTGVPTGTIWVDSDASSATINTNDFVLKSEAESYTPHGFLLMGA